MLHFDNFLFSIFITFCSLCIKQSVESVYYGSTFTRCKWIKNLTENVDNLVQHQYITLEECLYYNLSSTSDTFYKKADSLASFPPTKDADDRILIGLDKTTIKSFYVSEYVAPTITGSMNTYWNDMRLTWSLTDWKLDDLKIKAEKHIWVPDVNIDSQTIFSSSANFRNITVKRNGDVTARMDFRNQGACTTDFANYPQDIMDCCFEFKSTLYDSTVDFVIRNSRATVNFDKSGVTKWNLVDLDVKLVKDDERTNANLVNVCFKVFRRSSTLRMELTLPVAICAIIVIVSPLFGSMKQQIYVKLFALLLQFLCFQFLISRTPEAGFGDVVPKIYKFYEFTMAITLTSLLLTLLLNACGRSRSKMPPPHRFLLVSNAFNNRLFCCNVDHEDSKPEAVSDNAGNVSNWKEVFNAINNLVSVLILAIYILTAVIYTG